MSTAPPARLFEVGDTIRHHAKPEWGSGTVLKAERISMQGTPCQRLKIRFDRAGTKTVATAIAPIVLADDPGLVLTPADPEGDGSEVALPAWLENATEDQIRARFGALPADVTDRTATLPDRFARCLTLYRWHPDGQSLIDWAAAQTGLIEPLAVFHRGQLEAYFIKYQINRDAVLCQLVASGKRSHHAELVRVLGKADRHTQNAVQAALRTSSR